MVDKPGRSDQDGTVSLNADGGHHPYVALVRDPIAVPRVTVGAFTPPDAPGPARILFMTSMDLETARSFAEAMLATCRMAQMDSVESKATISQ